MSSKSNRSTLDKLRSKKRSRDEMVVPWLQMPGEPEEAFLAFSEYRKMAPEDRTISDLLKLPSMIDLTTSHKPNWFYKIANTWAWSSRAESFDNWSRYNHLTKQFGRFLESLDRQADIGRQLMEKAQVFLIGGEIAGVGTVEVDAMWLRMEPRDLISALKLGAQLERESFSIQREALVGNESFIELDELSQFFKPGSVQEQMFEAVVRDDWEGLMTIMEKVVNNNRSPEDMAMPSKGAELTEAQRERVMVMGKKLLKGFLTAPDELLAEFADEYDNKSNGVPPHPN